MKTEEKTMSIPIHSPVEIIAFNITEELNINDMGEFKNTMRVVYATIKQLHKNDLLKVELEQFH